MSAGTSWTRSDWAWLALPVAVCLAIRCYVAECAIASFNGDAAVHLLMGRHLAHGSIPLMFYGQGYVGSFEGMLSAPFYLLMGADVRGMGYAQALLACALVVQIYRVGHHLGGRLCALGASLPFAAGTKLLLENSAAQYGSYPSTQLFGVGAWLVALPMLISGTATRGRLAALGALVGLGLWNNPQVSSFVAPLVVYCWLRGHTLRLWRAGSLRAALGGLYRPMCALVGIAVVAVVGCVVLSFGKPYLTATIVPTDGRAPLTGHEIDIPDGQLRIRDHAGTVHVFPPGSFDKTHPDHRRAGEFELPWGMGRLKLTKPQRYMIRAVLALLGLLALIELTLAWRAVSDRRRVVGLVAALGAGFVVGFSPQIAFGLTRDRDVKIKKAPVGLHPGMATSHVRTLPKHLGTALIGRLEPEIGLKLPHPTLVSLASSGYRVSRYALIGVAFACLVGLLVVRREDVSRLVRLRAPDDPLPALIALQAAAMLTLYLGFPQHANEARYLQAMWVPLAALFGGSIAWLQRRRRRGAIALLVLISGSYLLGAAHNLTWLRWAADGRYSVDETLRYRTFAADGQLTAGFANFWIGYRVNYRSDEQVVLAPLPNESLRKYMPFVRRAQAARDRMWVLELPDKRLDLECYMRLLRGEDMEMEVSEGNIQRVHVGKIRHRRLIGWPRASRAGDSAAYVMFHTRR